MIRKWAATFMILWSLAFAAEAFARAGQAADDCPPNSKDPDCASANK